jgi:hypothetical protein
MVTKALHRLTSSRLPGNIDSSPDEMGIGMTTAKAIGPSPHETFQSERIVVFSDSDYQ